MKVRLVSGPGPPPPPSRADITSRRFRLHDGTSDSAAASRDDANTRSLRGHGVCFPEGEGWKTAESREAEDGSGEDPETPPRTDVGVPSDWKPCRRRRSRLERFERGLRRPAPPWDRPPRVRGAGDEAQGSQGLSAPPQPAHRGLRADRERGSP